MEIVVILHNGRFIVIGGGADVLAGPFDDDPFDASEFGMLADMDGDGVVEVVQPYDGLAFTPELLARHGDGAVVDGFPVSLPTLDYLWQSGAYLVLGDVDFDGRAEITEAPFGPATQNWPFYLLRGDGTLMPGFPADHNLMFCLTAGRAVFADIDGDFDSEVVGNGPGCLVGLRKDGSIHWSTESVDGSLYVVPAIGNFDADPSLEVAMGGYEVVRVFDPDTDSIIGTTDSSYSQGLRPTAADFNGDGIDELVVFFEVLNGVAQFSLHVLDVSTMTNIPGYPVVFPSVPGWHENRMGVIEDLDADGDFEIVCAHEPTIHVFSVPNPGLPVTRASWPTEFGNYAGNRDYHFGRMPQPKFIRGDANRDGMVNLADVVREVEALFLGATSSCPLAFDVNSDGALDIADPIALIGYQFLGAPPPAAPFPGCGAVANTPECLAFECP
jgi:hypothetical protein